jgi:uncharacterized protein (DUF3084 family)
MGDVFQGFSGFNAIINSLKGLKDINDANVRNTVAIELQQKILSAYQDQTALTEKIRELEEDVAAFKNWDAEKQRYKLEDLGEGRLVYALKPEMQGSEIAHNLCANCYSQSKKRILQKEQRMPGRATAYVCHDCNSCIYIEGNWHPDHEKRGARR